MDSDHKSNIIDGMSESEYATKQFQARVERLEAELATATGTKRAELQNRLRRMRRAGGGK